MAVGAKIGMKVLTIAIGVPVTIASRKAVERAWLALRPEDPPRDAKEADVSWTDAVTWGALSAVGLVAADLVKRKGAEQAYRVITGSEPPAAAGATPESLKQAEAQDKTGSAGTGKRTGDSSRKSPRKAPKARVGKAPKGKTPKDKAKAAKRAAKQKAKATAGTTGSSRRSGH